MPKNQRVEMMGVTPFPQALRPVQPGPVSIDLLTAEPSSDLRRIHVTVEISGEGHRPNLELLLSDRTGKELVRSFIIEVVDVHTEFTMHLRQQTQNTSLTLSCRAFFEKSEITSEKQITINL